MRRWARGGKRQEGFDLCNREQTKETDIRSPHGLSVSSVSGFTNYWNADVSPFHQRSALHHHYIVSSLLTCILGSSELPRVQCVEVFEFL